MRKALIASAVGHLAILVAGVIGFTGGRDLSVAPVDSLPVELVPVSEMTQLQLGTKEETEIREAAVKPAEKPPQEKPEAADRPGDNETSAPGPETDRPVQEAAVEQTPPPPAPEPEPEPAAEPAPEEAVSETAELGPEVDRTEEPEQQIVKVRPRIKPRVPPRPREPEPPKEQFDPNNIAALLNKTTPSGGGTSNSQQPASLGSDRGQIGVRMSQSELDALRSQVARCWNPPVGAVGAEELVVRLQFSMSENGEVQGQPKVLNANGNPAFNAAAQSAIRAVYRCGPYSLPISKYESWQTIILNFDPREMLGY